MKDVALCAEHIDISNAAKCVVANSLEDGAASYLNTVYKAEKNLALFMQALDKNFNQKVDERTREFTRWKELFMLTLEKPEDCDQFLNDFETSVSKLKEHKSKAVEDDCLMRAIVLHAVRAKEFDHCKIEITKDLSLDVEAILSQVRNHFLAIKTNQELIGAKPNQKSTRVCIAR